MEWVKVLNGWTFHEFLKLLYHKFRDQSWIPQKHDGSRHRYIQDLHHNETEMFVDKKVHDVYSGEQFSCEICGIALKCEQSYMNHKKSQHPSGKDLEDIPCQCAKCEIKFNTSDELNQHQIGS